MYRSERNRVTGSFSGWERNRWKRNCGSGLANDSRRLSQWFRLSAKMMGSFGIRFNDAECHIDNEPKRKGRTTAKEAIRFQKKRQYLWGLCFVARIFLGGYGLPSSDERALAPRPSSGRVQVWPNKHRKQCDKCFRNIYIHALKHLMRNYSQYCEESFGTSWWTSLLRLDNRLFKPFHLHSLLVYVYILELRNSVYLTGECSFQSHWVMVSLSTQHNEWALDQRVYKFTFENEFILKSPIHLPVVHIFLSLSRYIVR